MAEMKEQAEQQYVAKSAPMAKTEEQEATEIKNTRAAAKAKLDIAVEDDED